MAETSEGGLRRDIGLAGSAFLAFNGVVGAGIFALPATLGDQFGAFSPWLFPLFGLMALLIALPLARMAAVTSASGGPVAYTHAAFGPVAAFQVGWFYYIARVTALAANANVFVTYAAGFWLPLGEGIAAKLGIVLIIGALTALNVVGVRRAIRALDLLTIMKAAPLVFFALAAMFLFAERIELPAEPPRLGDVEMAALLIFYAFVGFENLLVPAEETRNARQTIPRAMLGTIAATAALYFLVQLAYVTVMEPGTGGDRALIAFGAAVAGPVGAVVLTVTALCSLTGNLTGNLIATPRVTYALAASGNLPGWFGRVSARYGTPANSILFLGVLGIAIAVSGSFVLLAVASTLARMLVYAAAIAAMPKLAPASRAMTVLLVAGGLGVCFWAMSQSTWEAWRLLLILALLGGGLYGIAALLRRR